MAWQGIRRRARHRDPNALRGKDFAHLRIMKDDPSIIPYRIPDLFDQLRVAIGQVASRRKAPKRWRVLQRGLRRFLLLNPAAPGVARALPHDLALFYQLVLERDCDVVRILEALGA